MMVPEAPMHENYLAKAREHKVWTTRQFTPMEPVTIAHTMNKAAHQHFGLGILAADASHAFAALRWGEGIDHLDATAF